MKHAFVAVCGISIGLLALVVAPAFVGGAQAQDSVAEEAPKAAGCCPLKAQAARAEVQPAVTTAEEKKACCAAKATAAADTKACCAAKGAADASVEQSAQAAAKSCPVTGAQASGCAAKASGCGATPTVVPETESAESVAQVAQATSE